MKKLRIHGSLIAAFTLGGIAGALSFTYAGFISAVPLSLTLASIALAPALKR